MKKTILIALALLLFVALLLLGFVFDNAWIVISSIAPLLAALITVFHNRIFRR